MNNNMDKLGFGFMRLPVSGPDRKVNIAETCKMVDHYLDHGFHWFDTAKPYHGGDSEVYLKQCVISRHDRDKLRIADKLTQGFLKDGLTAEQFFQEQLERTGAGYFDRYLLHAQDKQKAKECEEKGLWDFLFSLKERGLAREVGFSFHDTADVLDQILTAHPEVDFVQLQLNYIDWDNVSVQSRLCYETARKHNKPIIVMEPVKGGMLSSLSDDAMKLLNTPDRSAASWAIRYVASLPGVITVLSGMSNMDQLNDNMNTIQNLTPLTPDESARLAKVCDLLNNIPLVPCTRCSYCVEKCPVELPIPNLIGVLNSYRQFGISEGVNSSYRWYSRNHKPSECIQCGQCAKECPQHLDIPALMQELSDAKLG